MSRSGVYRAQAERAAATAAKADLNADYPGADTKPPAKSADECGHCGHPLADHGKYSCGIPVSKGSQITCRCPIRGESR